MNDLQLLNVFIGIILLIFVVTLVLAWLFKDKIKLLAKDIARAMTPEAEASALLPVCEVEVSNQSQDGSIDSYKLLCSAETSKLAYANIIMLRDAFVKNKKEQ